LFGGRLFLFGALVLAGMFSLQPNEAAILQLFGSYRGRRASRAARLQPVLHAAQISLRAATLNAEQTQGSTTSAGNPIRNRPVRRFWRVDGHRQGELRCTTATEKLRQFCRARRLRHLASSFAYDHGDLTVSGSPRTDAARER